MCEAKFTPEPWVCDIYAGNGQVDVVSSCGRKTLHCNKAYFGGALTDEDLVNAHLIAAAPEMYEELQEVSNWMNSQLGMGDWHKDIEQLLAKARGEHV